MLRVWFSRFGVCCVFILGSEGTVTQNCTYIRNPDYPSPYGQTSTIRYTITKCSPGKVGCKLPKKFFGNLMNLKIFRGLRHQVRLRELHLGWNHWHHRNYWRNMYRQVHHFGKYKRQSFTTWKRNLKKLYFLTDLCLFYNTDHLWPKYRTSQWVAFL